MTLDNVRTLYAYNSWANHRVLDACAPLSPAQFTENLHSSFASVRDTLVHIMLAEWLWLERWLGRSPGFPKGDFADLASICARWQKIEGDLDAFIQKLSAADLDRVVEYKNTKGNAFSNSMWQMLQHLVNHGTYHRGQITTMLRQLGATPLTTDLIAFYREQVGKPHN
ncbi:MAG TPA: DinB family protein [Candidatus Acidoferrales bacterium]|nr:DinB family protein [Candidatus Acidoferrales bacterium]